MSASPASPGAKRTNALPENSENATIVPTPIAMLVGSWLPFSETFIYEQLRLQRRTQAWVIAGKKTRYASRFPYERVIHLGLAEQLGFRYLGVAPSVDRVIASSGARLVFAHFGLNGAFALPFAQRAGLPLVVMFHGHDVGGLLPQNRYTARYLRYQRLARDLFDYASVLLCPALELKQKLAALGAPPHKLEVHRLGVDTSRFKPTAAGDKPAQPTLLSVGRLVEKKGMGYALAALAQLRRRFPEAELRIVGDGPLRRTLEQETRALGIQHAVCFLGNLPSSEVQREMARAHVMLTPSVTSLNGDQESGVIVLKEAAASGLPAVGTRHGGIPEIIEHERTGLLVAERNVHELASALERLLGDPDLRSRMGVAAREKICREYDNRVQNAALEELLLAHARPLAGVTPRQTPRELASASNDVRGS